MDFNRTRDVSRGFADPADAFAAGYDQLCATHPELSRADLPPHAKLRGLAHASGGRDGETATSMKTIPTLRVLDCACGPRSSCRCRWSGWRCGRRSTDAVRSG